MQHSVPDGPGPQSSAGHTGAIRSLPFDIIHILLDYTSPIDLLNLCCSCKALYAHFQNDSVWKHLSASYGLRDFTHFGGIPPRSIYTSLLYPYGGLLGLWAGDHPFTGSIMEFKVFPGDEREQGGIIGEVWHFPRSQTSTDDAVLPHYTRVLKISFGILPPNLSSPNTEPTPGSDTPQVYVLCDSDTPVLRTPPRTDPVHEVGTPHLSKLAFIPQSKTVHHIEFYRRTINLPEFPKPDAAWFDPSSARLPRLPALLDEPDADQSTIIKIFPALQLPKTWTSHTATAPHPAISIHCPHSRRCAYHSTRVPPSPFATLEPAHPQYFPLRCPLPLDPRAAADPRSATWTLDSLAGLWYGSYGAHGTEVLHLARGTAFWTSGMCATKLTGDVNVPRGAVSWVLEETDEHVEETFAFLAEVRGERPRRVLTGKGLLAARGFVESSVAGLVAVITDADEIQTFWAPLQVFRIYRRYKGREGEIHDLAQDE
ncbi:hypothetical protein GSI_01631 [Ganoderma sinense ZZ0214-1]|uniref:F-box domain-containing protein n=1 Tax=Ganoderma sinense ZZ0214-1 TaxID=1077348 RepID=A0A2G8SQC3_9APHY|nr:hypothetical protein GSI_01631 [Ganoderma sinense ZZ0214-1]